MIQIGGIFGFSVGIEYFDDEQFGFGINLDLGILRITWFRDVTFDDEE